MTKYMTEEEIKKINKTFKSTNVFFTENCTYETEVKVPEFVDFRFRAYEPEYECGGYFVRDAIKVNGEYSPCDSFYITYDGDGNMKYLIRVSNDNSWYRVYEAGRDSYVFFEEMGLVTDDKTNGDRVIKYTKEYCDTYNKNYKTMIITSDYIIKEYLDGRVEREMIA